MIGYDGLAFENPTQYAFTYDGLGRMIGADAIQGDLVLGASAATDPLFRAGDEQYTFDRIGNMRNVQRHGFFSATPTAVEQVMWQYQYVLGTSRLAQALAHVGSALPTRPYIYDAVGNLARDYHRAHKTAYGRAQLPVQVLLGNSSPHTLTYLYDAADQRIFKRERDENDNLVSQAFYLRDIAGRELGVWETEGEANTWTWYVFGNQRFARCTPEQQPEENDRGTGTPNSYINPFETNTLAHVSYFDHDHLGNTRVWYTPGCDGDEGARSYTLEHAIDYYPYGSILREYVEARAERYLTTMHERDQETGLDYRGARYYDSDVARFLSLDPLAAEYASWNSYSYVVGNPVNFTDPNGTNINPVFNSLGEYLGDTEEGFTGDVLIYDGDEEFSGMSKEELLLAGGSAYDLVRGSLTGDAKSKIWTRVVAQFEGLAVYEEKFSMSEMVGGKVHYGGAGSWSTGMISGKISGTDAYDYETTVENVASSVIVHEWYSHKQNRNQDDYRSHRLAYKNVINFKRFWNRTTDSYKEFNLTMLRDYTRDETGRTHVDPLYRRLYERYVSP